jgi:molecular chaperone DnaK (HSP70)
MDACKIAGLDCKRIINEPTAAALAYGLERMQAERKQILVFDLGGGTFDVSVLSIEQGIIEVLATRGDTHLGGQDIDEVLYKMCMEDFKTRFGIDLKKNSRAKARLRLQCTRAKHSLSS